MGSKLILHQTIRKLRFGSSPFQMGEYFEILAARVDPGRIRKRQRNDDGKTDPRRVRTLEDNRDAVRSTLTQALARALANLF
jgi:hypothetical protein